MHELIRYDAMCSAIAECHSVDELADMKNKARALELYAKQCKNTDAERRACEVRLRAERRTGELLKELARADHRRGNQHVAASNDATQPPSPYAEALDRTGISRQSASRYQALADVPEATFEAAMREPEKPTTSSLLAKAQAKDALVKARDAVPQMPADTLWLWGRLRDMERDGYFSKCADALLDPMTETMRADVARILPLAIGFLTTLDEAIHEPA